MVGQEALIPTTYFSYDDSAVFAVFVTKDVRSATTTAVVEPFGFNTGNVSAALDQIDELLKSGNTNAALMVMNMVTATLNGGSDVSE
jgi:hypothetical protein